MYTKACKCCCWAVSNKVSLLLISSLYCFCFSGHSADCCESMPGVPLQSSTRPAVPPAVIFAFAFWSTSSRAFPEPLAASSPPRPFLSPPGVTGSPRWVRTPLLISTSWRRCQCCWCPVYSPGSFLYASLGNHMDKALVTASWRAKCNCFTQIFSDLRAKRG